jgi:hypothetical protein
MATSAGSQFFTAQGGWHAMARATTTTRAGTRRDFQVWFDAAHGAAGRVFSPAARERPATQ